MNVTPRENCVEVLEWDTHFFGHRIARMRAVGISSDELIRTSTEARRDGIECIYLLVNMADVRSIRSATVAGFGVMDLRLTLDREIVSTSMPAGVRRATSLDAPALQGISHGAFKESRFGRDPRLSGHADHLYATWISRAIEGSAEAVLVSEDEGGKPLGFTCCHIRGPGRGELGLTAVREADRGRGIGEQLVAGALAWFHQAEMASVFVVTNGANIAAQRLYQRHGFLSRNVEVWYHGWLDAMR